MLTYYKCYKDIFFLWGLDTYINLCILNENSPTRLTFKLLYCYTGDIDSIFIEEESIKGFREINGNYCQLCAKQDLY